ncbi:MAG: HEAT repeat domain-containing protein [Planctomycetes bacterium]|nr:HEAT repeat domain-containing protein [Planctomycetota bacterium]MCC7169612.1 HEAT repeat domain-containing protein [Planctomycetota bacterium]
MDVGSGRCGRFGIVAIVAALCVMPFANGGDLSAALKKDLKSNDDDVRADAAKAALEQAGADAVAVVLRLAATDEHTRVRDVAFTALARAKDATVTAAVVTHGMAAKEAIVRATACEVLRERGDAGAGDAIAQALDDRDEGVVLAAVEAAGFVKPAQARPRLEAIAREGSDSILRAAALEALSRAYRADAVPVLVELVQDSDAAVAAEALHSLGFNDRELAARHVARVLTEHASTERIDVRLASALRDARRLRQSAVLEPLVRLLEHPRERVRSAAFVALSELTGLEIPPDPKAWGEWWTHYGATFDVQAKASKSVEPRSSVKFYGLPVASDRVVFVLDLSGSMRELDRSGKPRLDTARAAFAAAVEALPPSARFSVVVFGDAATAWSKELVPASPAKVEDAIKFLARQQARGKTNLFDGLRVAYGFDDVDTVVVLSDGAPSTGEFQYFQRIRHHVGRMNRTRGIAVSTVALAEKDDARAFLRELSEATGGVFTTP